MSEPKFSREEMEEMMNRWLAVNDKAEQEGNWRHLADFYNEDTIYKWDTPKGWYQAIGADEIRETCVGSAMDPYQGWTYPYEKIVIDHVKGEAFCTWWQVPPGAPKREDGSEMKVIGASWFKYGGDYKWSEQLDIFDYQKITDLIGELVQGGYIDAPPRMSVEELD